MIDAQKLKEFYHYRSGEDALEVRSRTLPWLAEKHPRRALFSKAQQDHLEAAKKAHERSKEPYYMTELARWAGRVEQHIKDTNVLERLPFVDMVYPEFTMTAYRRGESFPTAQLRVGFPKPDKSPGEALYIDVTSGNPRVDKIIPAEFNADELLLGQRFSSRKGSVLSILIPHFSPSRYQTPQISGFGVMSFANDSLNQLGAMAVMDKVRQSLERMRM